MEARALAADRAQDPTWAEESAPRPRLELVTGTESETVSALDIPGGRGEAGRQASRLAVTRSVEGVLADRRSNAQDRSSNFLEKVIQEMRRHGSPGVRAYRSHR